MNNDIKVRIKNLEERVSFLEGRLSGEESHSNQHGERSRGLSVNEFLKSKNLVDDVKRTLAIAYWLDHYRDLESFIYSDIQEGFRTAKLKVPSNVNDKINMNVRNGHLAEEKEKREGKKAWYITSSGIQYVEEELAKIIQ